MNKYGTTASSIAYATQIAIQHNIKVLLISTSFNDSLVKDSFWQEKKKSILGLGTNSKNVLDTSGIEGLDRIMRSNKVSPEMITDYAKIVLTDRLEILLGIEGNEGQYSLIKERYPQVITLASKYYDMVIVDLSRKVGEQTEIEILKASDVIVATVSQRAKKIKELQEKVKQMDILNENNTILLLGEYMAETKYNAKNITRTLLKRRDLINTIPYNNIFFEASQEGKVIDVFLNFMRLKEKDDNYIFIEEIKRLIETVNIKVEMQQMQKIK